MPVFVLLQGSRQCAENGVTCGISEYRSSHKIVCKREDVSQISVDNPEKRGNGKKIAATVAAICVFSVIL